VLRYVHLSQRFFSCFLDLYSIDFVAHLSETFNTLNVVAVYVVCFFVTVCFGFSCDSSHTIQHGFWK